MAERVLLLFPSTWLNITTGTDTFLVLHVHACTCREICTALGYAASHITVVCVCVCEWMRSHFVVQVWLTYNKNRPNVNFIIYLLPTSFQPSSFLPFLGLLVGVVLPTATPITPADDEILITDDPPTLGEEGTYPSAPPD